MPLAPHSLKFAAFLVFVATLFFWLSAFSTPYIKSMYYLRQGVSDVKFGNCGWCAGEGETRVCLPHTVGYYWRPEIPQGKGLTGSLILVALTAAFGTLAFFSLLHSIYDLRSGLLSISLAVFTIFLSTLSALLVLITFGTAHHRFSNESLEPHYGNAFMLVIVGWLLYLSALPFVIIGWFRERHYRRERDRGVGAGPVVGDGAGLSSVRTEKKRRWF